MDEKYTTLYRAIEAVILFIGLPLLYWASLLPLPKIIVLLLVAGYCGYQLWDDSFFGKGVFQRKRSSDVTKNILVRSILVAIGIVGLIWLIQPNRFFAFPQEQPIWWMAVMIFYPVLSALPQEFIYRTYFFHKYEDLIPLKNSTVILSALAFSFLHIVYHNWWAVGLSFIAGLLFAITYDRTKSLFWVTVEHTIYGWLIFTLGLGNYFYGPF